ncbi:MAG: hypothetical protein GXZ01_04155 [Clostridiaceae bacterium]|nr:hypothetical protein [Clostridiaceae bacterium]
MNREEYMQKYISDPVQFNARYQAQGKYPGLDPLHNEIVPKGTLLAALEIEGAAYFIKAEELLNHNMGASASDIGASCMVQPWLKDNYQDTASYRYNIRIKEQSNKKILGKRSFAEKYAEQIAGCERVEAVMAELGIKSPEEFTGKIAVVEGRMKELAEQMKFKKIPLRLQIQSAELVRTAERCLAKGKEPKVPDNLAINRSKPKRAISIER